VAWLRTAPKWRPFPGYPRRQIILSADRLGLRGEDGSVLKELVRFGVQFPDSAKVTNFDWALRWPGDPEAAHGMESRGGSGSPGGADQEFWIWPIPATGDILLVCEWPAYDIAESRLTLSGDDLRAAARQARPIWPDESALTHTTRASRLGRQQTGSGHRAASYRFSSVASGKATSKSSEQPDRG